MLVRSQVREAKTRDYWRNNGTHAESFDGFPDDEDLSCCLSRRVDEPFLSTGTTPILRRSTMDKHRSIPTHRVALANGSRSGVAIIAVERVQITGGTPWILMPFDEHFCDGG